jgi:hypothetical protein
MIITEIVGSGLSAILSTRPLEACLCVTDASGTQAGDAATYGVIAMAILMFAVLGALYGFMRYLQWREQNPLPDYSDLVNEGEKALKGEVLK